jgi:hypothetical protein
MRTRRERDEARERLRADVQAGFDQLQRGEGRPYDKTSSRTLADHIRADGRANLARARKAVRPPSSI